MRARPAVVLQLVLAALLPTLRGQSGALHRRGGAVCAAELSHCADNSTGAFTRSGPYAYQVRCSCGLAVAPQHSLRRFTRRLLSPQVCEEQPGEVPGVNVSGGGSRCIPVRRLCCLPSAYWTLLV